MPPIKHTEDCIYTKQTRFCPGDCLTVSVNRLTYTEWLDTQLFPNPPTEEEEDDSDG